MTFPKHVGSEARHLGMEQGSVTTIPRAEPGRETLGRSWGGWAWHTWWYSSRSDGWYYGVGWPIRSFSISMVHGFGQVNFAGSRVGPEPGAVVGSCCPGPPQRSLMCSPAQKWRTGRPSSRSGGMIWASGAEADVGPKVPWQMGWSWAFNSGLTVQREMNYQCE